MNSKLQAYFESFPARYPEMRGQVAIVTGAGRRIGLGIATRFAREGMRLVMGGLDTAELADSVAGLRACGVDAQGVPGDLSDPAVLDALFTAASNYGRLDLLVNNAADLRRVRAEDLTPELIDAQLSINIRVPMLLSLRALALMRPARGGSIVNITSVGGLRAQHPGLPYGMTKGALEALTRNLAADLGDYNIRVNAVAPGWTPTPPDEPDADYDAYIAATSPNIPLRRPGSAADIGAAVAFLASSDAAYVTGHTLVVDGGLVAQLHPPENPI